MDLTAQTRIVMGKKVKALRRQGITPANLYGRDMESQALQLDTAHMQQVLKTTGRNALINLTVGDGKGRRNPSHNVMVRDVQRDPLYGRILHIDFYRVQMTERMEVEVPVILVGVAPAVDLNLGTLVHGANVIRVQGLPATLPSAVEADVTVLAEARQIIQAKDIALPPDVSLASDPEQVVASIVVRRVGVVEEVEKPEEEAAAAEAAPAEAAREEEQ